MKIDDPITAKVKQAIWRKLEAGEHVPKKMSSLISPEEYWEIEKRITLQKGEYYSQLTAKTFA